MANDVYFWVMIILAFIMSFSIGSNETDALAMAYSSGAMNMFTCVSIHIYFRYLIVIIWKYIWIHWSLFLFFSSIRYFNQEDYYEFGLDWCLYCQNHDDFCHSKFISLEYLID